MMKNLTMPFAALALMSSLAGCGKKADGGGGGGGDETKVPTMTVNEGEWVSKNLHDVAPLINVTMKVPKDAKLEKNGNGGVDVRVNEFYMLTVSQLAVSGIPEAIKSDKSLTVERTDSYINTKVLSEEPNGFVYTMQMKDEANGTKYQPEAHFAYYLDKEGAIYSVQDQKPLDAWSTPGSAYSPEIANKVYAIVKASTKAN